MAKNTVLSHLSLDLPKTRIMATIGNSNYKTEQLENMLHNGASIFRFNAARIEKGYFNFGTKPNLPVSSVLKNINLLSEARRQPIATSLDLAGPKVRVKKLISIHEREKTLKKEKQWNRPYIGDVVYLYSDNVNWDDEHIRETLPIDENTLKPIAPSDSQGVLCIDKTWRLQTTIDSFKTIKENISIKNGRCNLRIQSCSPKNDFVRTIIEEVAYDFFFSQAQGVNPKGYIFPYILQQKDFEDLEWALENDFDLICVSFVCSPLEYFELKKRIVDLNKNRKTEERHSPLIFAKIETIFAVDKDEAINYCKAKGLKDQKVYEKRVAEKDHERYLRLIDLYIENPIKAICETYDGVVVARGDLAVEADKYHVPFYQKAIINVCRLFNKPVIIATEVLQSMVVGSPSTRAEIGDISAAVLEGADIIMLGREVASSKSDPALVVKELRTAIQTAEKAKEEAKWLGNYDDVQYFDERFSRILHNGELYLKEMEVRKLLPAETVESVRRKIVMGDRVCLAARLKDASAIFVVVTTGETAKYVSYFQPAQQIISIGSSMLTAKRLLLWKGIYPVVTQYHPKHDMNDFILVAREIHSVIRIKPTDEWKDKKEFVIPGLMRIESKLQDENDKKLLPNAVYDIPLPNPPKSIPEREIKYILTEPCYKKLKEHIERRYKVKEVVQQNHYFYDKSGVIMDNKAMVRIRIEKIEHTPERAIITIKKKGKKANGGTRERWEKEFNVTPYFFSKDSRNHIEVSFDRLPDFFRELLWNEFQEDFKGKNIASPGDIDFENVASMVNTRLTVETASELTLELDAFSTREDCKYFELEIETIAVDEARRDEYIELLLGFLGIPIVCHQDYPTKFVRTLLDFGLLEMNDRFRNAIDYVKNKLGVS
ncbi:MAG: CYTH domain-containing protein [Candidatus Aminicenantes bacterium]|nr:MAG: CYTH domain-containing protein [Candidatus Aminicenantes bacterium]